jgi:hypothetical protein
VTVLDVRKNGMGNARALQSIWFLNNILQTLKIFIPGDYPECRVQSTARDRTEILK